MSKKESLLISENLDFLTDTRRLMKRSNGTAIEIVNKDLFDVTDILEAETAEYVRCDKCGKYHDKVDVEDGDKVRYFALFGNLHTNFYGCVMGGSGWDKFGVPVRYYCPECLITKLKKLAKLEGEN